jgi:hypothetical protein
VSRKHFPEVAVNNLDALLGLYHLSGSDALCLSMLWSALAQVLKIHISLLVALF